MHCFSALPKRRETKFNRDQLVKHKKKSDDGCATLIQLAPEWRYVARLTCFGCELGPTAARPESLQSQGTLDLSPAMLPSSVFAYQTITMNSSCGPTAAKSTSWYSASHDPCEGRVACQIALPRRTQQHPPSRPSSLRVNDWNRFNRSTNSTLEPWTFRHSQG